MTGGEILLQTTDNTTMPLWLVIIGSQALLQTADHTMLLWLVTFGSEILLQTTDNATMPLWLIMFGSETLLQTKLATPCRCGSSSLEVRLYRLTTKRIVDRYL